MILNQINKENLKLLFTKSKKYISSFKLQLNKLVSLQNRTLFLIFIFKQIFLKIYVLLTL